MVGDVFMVLNLPILCQVSSCMFFFNCSTWVYQFIKHFTNTAVEFKNACCNVDFGK